MSRKSGNEVRGEFLTLQLSTKVEESEKTINPAMSKAEIKKAAAAIQKMRKHKDAVEETFGSSGDIASSFYVDPDWDSTEGLDVRSLVA
jgi:hypothetical protein